MSETTPPPPETPPPEAPKLSKRKLLIVALDTLAGQCADTLANKGFEIHIANTIVDALHYLRNEPDAEKTTLLVQENLATGPRRLPNAFADVSSFERGAAFIKYARDEGLINMDTPAYLMTVDLNKYPDLMHPSEITRVLYLRDGFSLADAMRPPHLPRESKAAAKKVVGRE
jgi:hypothetical protein